MPPAGYDSPPELPKMIFQQTAISRIARTAASPSGGSLNSLRRLRLATGTAEDDNLSDNCKCGPRDRAVRRRIF